MTPNDELELVGGHIDTLDSDLLFSDFSIAKEMPAPLEVVRRVIKQLVEAGKIEREGLSHRAPRDLYRRVARIRKLVTCPDCNGTKHYPGSVVAACSTCDSTGKVEDWS